MTEAQLRDPIWFTKPMPYHVWILRVMILEPDRIFDPAERKASIERHIQSQAIMRGGRLETLAETRERIESVQWRRGRGQGLLAGAGVSPLNSERRKNGAAA